MNSFACKVTHTSWTLRFILELWPFFTWLVYTTMGYRQTVQDEGSCGGSDRWWGKDIAFLNFIRLIVLPSSLIPAMTLRQMSSHYSAMVVRQVKTFVMVVVQCACDQVMFSVPLARINCWHLHCILKRAPHCTADFFLEMSIPWKRKHWYQLTHEQIQVIKSSGRYDEGSGLCWSTEGGKAGKVERRVLQNANSTS